MEIWQRKWWYFFLGSSLGHAFQKWYDTGDILDLAGMLVSGAILNGLTWALWWVFTYARLSVRHNSWDDGS